MVRKAHHSPRTSMALSFFAFPHSKTATKVMLLNSISRIPSLNNRCVKYRAASNPPQFSSPTFSYRFLCSCYANQHGPMDAYKESFARRMAMAGLKPHQRIALGVSGGPDSMALCALAAAWKITGDHATSKEHSEFINGLLAIVVDHGLRAESSDEANLVCARVTKMGIRCEIVHCEWLDGRPKQGHLQKAAREKRYEIFQNLCSQHQIGVLLLAHHADDQAELFILRLSRNSGVLGLAGMAFTSELFAKCQDLNGEALNGHGILLVRPLLELSKEDMYKICQENKIEWVEDPTNQNSVFARNRIRMSLNNLSSSAFKSELRAIISSCRKIRAYVDGMCACLIHQAVTIMPQGYAVVDLGILNPSEVKDIVLSKFLALLLQFISQRHRPVRGSASKLLLEYIRSAPCRTSVTAAGCYLCPAPGSKGTKVLVCCSVDSNSPLHLELFQARINKEENCFNSREQEQMVSDGRIYSDKFDLDALDVKYLDLASSDSILDEAKSLGILSESTHRCILSLQSDEGEIFKSRTRDFKDEVQTSLDSPCKTLSPGQVGYLLNRFLVNWDLSEKMSCNMSSDQWIDLVQDFGAKIDRCCTSCLVGCNMVAQVRLMIDADWMYLAELSRSTNVSNLKGNLVVPKTGEEPKILGYCSDHVKLSAQRALMSLKSVPVAARRSLPVLVSPQGLLLSIPAVGFVHCPCIVASAVFKPRIPLGGGHSSYI